MNSNSTANSHRRGKISRKIVKGAKPYSKLLGSAEYENLLHYVSRRHKYNEVKYFDGKLLDNILSHVRDPRERQILKESVKAKEITKVFYDPENTISQLDGYLTSEKPSFQWNENFRSAVNYLKEIYLIKENALRPILIRKETDLFQVFTNLNTSAGAVNAGRKKKDSIPQIFKTSMKMKQLIKDRSVPFESIQLPALPLHRAQISDYYDVEHKKLTPEKTKHKDRLVWCVDAATVAIEAQYARPAINAICKSVKSYAGGMSFKEIRDFINGECRTKSWIGLDYSKFDQTIPSWLIWEMFEVIKSWYAPMYHRELDWIRYNFINTKIFNHDGEVITKHKGVPSGSNFTQLIGSMANLCMTLTYLFSLYGNDKKRVKQELVGATNRRHGCTIITMGDDALICTYTPLDLNHFSSYVLRNFGVKINVEKTDYGTSKEDPKFLKREWRINGEYRDFIEMWINSIHAEYMRDYDGYTPWHIIYGMFLTYEESMNRYYSRQEIVKNLLDTGLDATSFKNLTPYDVPGSMRAIMLNDANYLYREFRNISEGLMA